METPKTPMDNLLNMLSGLSAGHEKALKQGIYNAVAIFLLCVVCAAGFGLYIVLSPFLKPLIWALLCGSVLYPFKSSLSTIVQSWFVQTEKSSKPLIISLTLLPVNIFDQLSELIGSFLQKYLRYILVVIILLITGLTVYDYTPKFLCFLISRLLMILNNVISFFISTCNIYSVGTIILGYFSVLYLYWTPKNSVKFRYTSFFVWLILSMYLSNVLGTYPLVVFVSLQILFLIGFIYEVLLVLDHQELNGKKCSFIEAVSITIANQTVTSSSDSKLPTLLEDESFSDSEKSETNENEKKEWKALKPKPFLKVTGKSLSVDGDIGKTLHDHPARRAKSASNVLGDKMSISDRYFLRKLRADLRMSFDLEDNNVDTDKYMYGAMYACIGMILWKNKWIVVILIIPIAYYYLKQLYIYFGIGKIILDQYNKLIASMKFWCLERQQALLPVSVKGVFKVSIIVDQKMTQILKESVDAVATTAVIVGLLVFVLCSSIFITFQVYSEGLHLVQISGEILNSTLMNHPDIDWVPQQWEDSVNSVLNNAYVYGRSALSDGIKKLVKELDPGKADQMEKKFLELWDRLYQAYMMADSKSDMIGPTVDMDSAWETFKDGFGKSPYQFFNMTSIQNFAKENIGILLSVLDSVWSLVKGNMSVLLSIITELTYIVLMSGSAVLSFSLSMVVFFTALFYLLSSSGNVYKPIELITNFSPISCHRPDEKGFAMALQESIIGVFTATFKLASFFGMWTWFLHNLFQVKIVYLPSFFATLFGAVPLLDAYFACIPASIELWFNQGPLTAIIFFLFHFLACNIVVTEFYKEIKGGGHPYLTGLSIAGGVFCLGIEGAIFGPLLLCCIMVAINLSRRYLQSPSEEAINSIKSQIDQMES